MRHRVLLVSPNREGSPELAPPVGLAHLAGASRAGGIEPRILDLLVEDDPDGALGAAVDAFDPHVIGLGVRNIDTTAYPNGVYFVNAASNGKVFSRTFLVAR